MLGRKTGKLRRFRQRLRGLRKSPESKASLLCRRQVAGSQNVRRRFVQFDIGVCRSQSECAIVKVHGVDILHHHAVVGDSRSRSGWNVASFGRGTWWNGPRVWHARSRSSSLHSDLAMHASWPVIGAISGCRDPDRVIPRCQIGSHLKRLTLPTNGIHANGKTGRRACRFSDRLQYLSQKCRADRKHFSVDKSGDRQGGLHFRAHGSGSGYHFLPHCYRELLHSSCIGRGRLRLGKKQSREEDEDQDPGLDNAISCRHLEFPLVIVSPVNRRSLLRLSLSQV
jgi:hypothetical protein